MGWWLRVGEAKPRTVPLWERTRAWPLGCEARGLALPPQCSQAFKSLCLGTHHVPLTTCLSPTVLPSFLTSPQTPCDGWVLWVATPLSVDHVETDGKSQPSLTAHIPYQQAWRMLGHVGLSSSTGL